MNLWLILTFVCVLSGVHSFQQKLFNPNAKTNLTGTNLCNYDYSYEYKFNTFYKLDDLPSVRSGGRIHLKLYAIAKRDIQILFSTKHSISNGDKCVEIVVAADGDRENIIRGIQKHDPSEHHFAIPNQLKMMEPNTIDIHINDGNVTVTVNALHYSRGYLNLTSIPLNYLSFATYDQSPQHIYFNCTDQMKNENNQQPHRFFRRNNVTHPLDTNLSHF